MSKVTISDKRIKKLLKPGPGQDIPEGGAPQRKPKPSKDIKPLSTDYQQKN